MNPLGFCLRMSRVATLSVCVLAAAGAYPQCDQFRQDASELDQRADQLRSEWWNCETQTLQQCGRLSNGTISGMNAFNACMASNHPNPEQSDCGPISYTAQRCRAAAYAFQCTIARRDLANRDRETCESNQVNDLQQAQRWTIQSQPTLVTPQQERSSGQWTTEVQAAVGALTAVLNSRGDNASTNRDVTKDVDNLLGGSSTADSGVSSDVDNLLGNDTGPGNKVNHAGPLPDTTDAGTANIATDVDSLLSDTDGPNDSWTDPLAGSPMDDPGSMGSAGASGGGSVDDQSGSTLPANETTTALRDQVDDLVETGIENSGEVGESVVSIVKDTDCWASFSTPGATNQADAAICSLGRLNTIFNSNPVSTEVTALTLQVASGEVQAIADNLDVGRRALEGEATPEEQQQVFENTGREIVERIAPVQSLLAVQQELNDWENTVRVKVSSSAQWINDLFSGCDPNNPSLFGSPPCQ